METLRVAKETRAAVEWGDGSAHKNLSTVDRDGVEEFTTSLLQQFRGLVVNITTSNMHNNILGEWMICQDAGNLFQDVAHFSTWKTKSRVFIPHILSLESWMMLAGGQSAVKTSPVVTERDGQSEGQGRRKYS